MEAEDGERWKTTETKSERSSRERVRLFSEGRRGMRTQGWREAQGMNCGLELEGGGRAEGALNHDLEDKQGRRCVVVAGRKERKGFSRALCSRTAVCGGGRKERLSGSRVEMRKERT
jgi:hypothetical protein